MHLRRVDFQRDIDPPGRNGKTGTLTDLGKQDRNLEMHFADGLVTIVDRGTQATIYVPIHNVARMEPHPNSEPKAASKGKR